MAATDDIQGIRAAATANKAALVSVDAQAAAQMAAIALLPASPSKGALHDSVARLRAGYQEAARRCDVTIATTTRILALLGAAGGGDTPPAPTIWSTGAW